MENVASRLGLTVLSYLWEQDQTSLLREMIGNGLHAILIKVACVGLDKSQLGQSLAQIEARMANLKAKYQVHPCGEGGEYETIVLDCPLFSKKLTVTATDIVELEGDTAYLKLKASLATKDAYDRDWKLALQQNLQLEEPFQEFLDDLKTTSFSGSFATEKDHPMEELPEMKSEMFTNDVLTCTLYLDQIGSPPLIDLAQQDPDRVLFCQIILQDMADFASVNAEYGRLWTKRHPPARVCISSPLPKGIRYALYAYAMTARDAPPDPGLGGTDPVGKRLWVQSRSYWAPSNIGPYSQLALCNGILFTSGQIGLIPATMKLAGTIEEEIIWSLQSLYRITLVHQTQDYDGAAICYILSRRYASHVQQAWKAVQQELMTGKVDLLIVQLLPGSRLPREANVEWQFIAAPSGSSTRISMRENAGRSMIPLGFNTRYTTEHAFLLPATCILLNDQSVERACLCVDLRLDMKVSR